MSVIVEEEKTENPEKNPRGKARTNNNNGTQATLVRGERSHHGADFVEPVVRA